MSDGMNKVFLMGNLGTDPEVRYTSTGTAVLHFRMATNESFLDRNRELTERTEWHSVVMFGTRAEGLARVLSKGSCLLVEGTLRTSTYEKDGVKRYRTEIHARDICFAAGGAARDSRGNEMTDSVREPEENVVPTEMPPLTDEMPPMEQERPAAASSVRPQRNRRGAAGAPRRQEVVEQYPF